MEITIEEIQEKFKSLPEELRWAIMAADVDSKIIDIGEKYKLTVPQMQQLSLETHAVMLGYTHPKNFENSVKNSLQFSNAENTEIVKEINEKILKEIREKLKELYKNPDIDSNDKIPKTEETINTPDLTSNNGDQIEDREELLKHIENPMPTPPIRNDGGSEKLPSSNETSSIISQKLSGSFQIPKTETEHSLNNITKDTSQEKIKLPQADPYRMPIE